MHINSERPIPLKNSIRYSQVLRSKRTCSTIGNFKVYCSELKPIEKGYKSDLLDKHISAVEKLDRNEMRNVKGKSWGKAETNMYSVNINLQSLLSKHR